MSRSGSKDRNYARMTKAELIRELDGLRQRLRSPETFQSRPSEAEAALEETRRDLAKAQRLAQIGYWRWSIPRDELVDFSAEFARIHGVQPGQIRELMREQMERVIHPDDRDRVAEAFRKVDEEGLDYEIDYRILRPDGSVRHVEERGEVVLDPSGRPLEHTGTLQDITERKHAEEALRRSEARTRAAEQRLLDAIECISEGFALYDCEDRLVLFNKKWMELYGYSPSRVYPGVRYEDLVRLDAELGAVADDESDYVQRRIGYRRRFKGAFDVHLKDGRWITIRERETSDGGIVGIQTDITERKRAERALLTAKEEADLANRAKSEFLANMSHELRTPLNAIIGFAEVIKNQLLGPGESTKYQFYADDIASSGRHLLDIIDDILDLSKIESGKVDLHEIELDVRQVVEACVSLTAERAERGAVALNVETGSGSEPWLYADKRMLMQILVNLLSNAIKFTPPGGTVTIKTWHDRDDAYIIEIADTGIGIAPKDIPKALTRFEQVDGDLGRKFEGSGLGLPLVNSLVELHDGALDLQSEVGAGTVVTVRFPAERAVERRADDASSDKAAG